MVISTVGSVVTLTLNMSEAVTVAGGTPTLTLNDGGTATYTGGSGGAALTFSYTVGAGQNTPDLTVTAVNLNGASIKDSAGNAATLSGTLTPPGTLQIDTTAPAAPAIAGDTVNANNTVTLNGTAEANTTVTIYDGQTALGTTAANAAGAWTYTTGTLANGPQVFTATATDAAGNTSPVSSAVDPVIGSDPNSVSSSVEPVSSPATTVDSWRRGTSANWSNTADWNSGLPVSSDLVVLNAARRNYTVTSSADETIAELNTGRRATLSIASGIFIITNGTGAGVQAGTVSIASGATLEIDGVFNNTGTILVNGGTLNVDGNISGGTTEIGGAGEMVIAQVSNENVAFLASSTGQLVLDNSTSYTGEISGFGANTSQSIDLSDLNFTAGIQMNYVPNSGNTGGVLTLTDGTNTANLELEGGYTLANFVIANDGDGGTLLIDPKVDTQSFGNASASSGASPEASDPVVDQGAVTVNAGPIAVSDGGILPLGGTVDNTGSIALDSTGDQTELKILDAGATLQGGGQVTLSDNSQNLITGETADATLTNVDNDICGAGQFGGAGMTLVNHGTINADGTNALIVDTGTNVVANSGILEATGSGGLIINSTVDDTGDLCANGGNITINDAVTGDGTATISGAATLEFGAASSENISFAAGATGTLKLDQSPEFTGTVSGFGAGDALDLTDIAFGANATIGYSLNGDSTGGTLSVSDGAHTANVALFGQYAAAGFQLGADQNNGAIITCAPAEASQNDAVLVAKPNQAPGGP